jgi:hypothetical protein
MRWGTREFLLASLKRIFSIRFVHSSGSFLSGFSLRRSIFVAGLLGSLAFLIRTIKYGSQGVEVRNERRPLERSESKKFQGAKRPRHYGGKKFSWRDLTNALGD